MWKVKNKKVINRLSRRTLAARRKKNIVVILAIVLTTMLFTALFTVAGAINESFQESTMRQVGGKSMAGLKCILPEDFEKIAKDSAVKDPSYRIVVGNAINEELRKVATEVNYAEDENAKDMFCYPTEGTMPKKRLEVATSTVVLDALGIPCKIGETVPLTIFMDGENGGTIRSNFTLSGYWEGDPVAMAQECWVSKEFCEEVAPTPETPFQEQEKLGYTGYWMMDFDYSNSWDIEAKTIALLERNGYDSNIVDYGINWAYMTSSVDTESIVLMGVILFLILASGYLIIYNIFSLNVVGDIQSYGLLKTIGTTEKQLKRLVRKQAYLLSLIGIPCGLIFGVVVGKCLFPIIVRNFEIGSVIKFSVKPMFLVGAALFSFLTVWISCNKPCKVAASVSPVEAVRYTDTSYRGKKKEKKSKKVSTGSFAWANVGRNRKKVVIVVLSLSLSIILLNCVYSLVSGFDKDKFVSQYLVGDVAVTDASILNFASGGLNLNGITPKVQKDLQEMDGVESIHNVYFDNESSILFDETAYKNMMDFIDHNPDYFSDEYAEWEVDALKENKALCCDLYGIDEWGKDQLQVCKGKVDWEKFQTGKYALINTFGMSWEQDPLMGVYYDVGDTLELVLPDGTKKKYEVMALASVPYSMTSRRFSLFDTRVILPETEYLANIKEDGAMITMLSLDEKKETAVNQALENYTENVEKNLTYVSKQTYEKEFKEFTNMFWIVGGALSFVLALIGILNFINSIVTGILARKKELAMMEAVGMTGKQMKGMLAWEGIFYIVLTSVFSVVSGSLLSWIVLKKVAEGMWFLSYHFTVMPIVACIPILVLLACVIPITAYHNMAKESTVERLRENE
mgnify:CR=1 FL=1